MKELKNAYEVADIIGVTAATIYNWVARGLPYTEVSKGTTIIKKFDVDEVKKWVENNRS